MEGKKMYYFIGLLGLLLVSPLLTLNNAAMGCYQRRIDKYPDSQSSKDWQWRLGAIYYNTLRTEKAADSYQRFYKTWPDEKRRPAAIKRHAEILEELQLKREAIEVWKILAREYPEDNLGKLALAKLQNDYKVINLDPLD